MSFSININACLRDLSQDKCAGRTSVFSNEEEIRSIEEIVSRSFRIIHTKAKYTGSLPLDSVMVPLGRYNFQFTATSTIPALDVYDRQRNGSVIIVRLNNQTSGEVVVLNASACLDELLPFLRSQQVLDDLAQS